MKRGKKLAKDNIKPIWKHFTANKPAKTKVSRKISTRTQTKKMPDNPLTNVLSTPDYKRKATK